MVAVSDAMLAIYRAEAAAAWAAASARLSVHAVGDQVRVVACSAIISARHMPAIGTVGTVVEVLPLAACSVVFSDGAQLAYLVDFGPDETNRHPDSRIRWAYPDSDLRPASAPWKPMQRKGRKQHGKS